MSIRFIYDSILNLFMDSSKLMKEYMEQSTFFMNSSHEAHKNCSGDHHNWNGPYASTRHDKYGD